MRICDLKFRTLQEILELQQTIMYCNEDEREHDEPELEHESPK